jgi:alkanesulfonate monooxygenase SsuD/methylene tetrahydromethanopterin reductase-like flavin-dependent oxidoreductase (luciferase family)
VKFGLYVSEQHPSGDMTLHLDDHLEQVRTARDAGFQSVFAGHHYLSSPYQSLQPMPFLARIAAESGEMRVGAGILLTALLNPVDAVEQATTLDIITKGRFVLGVGLGYRDVEFDAFGIPRDRRVEVYTEGLSVMKQLWSGDEVNVETERWRLRGVRLNTFPVQRPHPPIWMAANSDAAVRRAAEFGDTWFISPHTRLPVLKRQMDIYLRTLEELGRPLPHEIPIIKDAFVGVTSEEAWREARPYLEEKYRVYVDWGQHKPLPADDDLDMPFEELLRDRFIVGDPEDVIAQVERYRQELGVNHVVFRLQWPGRDSALKHERVIAAIELLGKHVLRRFTSSTASAGVC